jgi:hypothetical protein
MRALTDAELAALILEAVKAERAACATACADVAGQFLEPKKAVAWLCYSAIRDRDLAGCSNGTVSDLSEAPQAAGDLGELRDAARAFYNATVGQPLVRITSSSESLRDVAANAAKRLRCAIVATSPAACTDGAGSACIDGTVSKPDTAQHETPTSN